MLIFVDRLERVVESTPVVAAPSRSSSPRSPSMCMCSIEAQVQYSSSPSRSALQETAPLLPITQLCPAVPASTMPTIPITRQFSRRRKMMSREGGERGRGGAVNTVAVSVVASPHMRLCPANLILPRITTFLTPPQQ